MSARTVIVCLVARAACRKEQAERATAPRRTPQTTDDTKGEHPAVEAARELHQVNSISFNAPVELAIHVDVKTLKPLIPFEPLPDDLDSRWRGADPTGFAAKVGASRQCPAVGRASCPI